MELIGLGYNMMASNDSRYIKKNIKNIDGLYRYVNYCDKTIYDGIFLKGVLKNGIIINYTDDMIIINYVDNFKIDINKKIKTTPPYFCYTNAIITDDGTMYNENEYYCNFLDSKSKKLDSKSKKLDSKKSIQLYINDYHSTNKIPLNYYKIIFDNGICNIKFIDDLPFDISTMHKFSKVCNSINELLTL
jgi:hypothetical protein